MTKSTGGKKQNNNNTSTTTSTSSASSTPTLKQHMEHSRVLNARLIATDKEKEATSKSLYFDHGCRISAHPPIIDDTRNIEKLEKLFAKKTKGKRVLFVCAGLGLGIVPMLCLRHGATRVVAVDDSAVIPLCIQLAKENNLDMKALTFLQGNICTGLTLPEDCPLHSFDFIYCDWVSTFVVSDAPRIAQCLYARDHYLKKDGTGEVLPRKAYLHAFGVSDYECYQNSVEWWSNVYGFKMETMRQCVINEPVPGNVWPESCITDVLCVAEVNIMDLKAAATAPTTTTTTEGTTTTPVPPTPLVLNLDAKFQVRAAETCTMHYLTVYPSCEFDDDYIVSCGPGESRTCCFSQVSLGLPVHIPMQTGETVSFTLGIDTMPKTQPPCVKVVLKGETTNTLITENQRSFEHTYIHAEYR